MPKFVLHYFDARGRGEPARLLFAVAGIPFQDRRVSQEEWPAIKPSMFIACFNLLRDLSFILDTAANFRFVGLLLLRFFCFMV